MSSVAVPIFVGGPISEHHAQSCSLEYDIFQTYKPCDVVCETLKVYTFFRIFIFQSESISEAVNVKVAKAVDAVTNSAESGAAGQASRGPHQPGSNRCVGFTVKMIIANSQVCKMFNKVI